jgi:hypothetical protein
LQPAPTAIEVLLPRASPERNARGQYPLWLTEPQQFIPQISGSGPTGVADRNEASREVYTEVLGNDGKLQEKEQLWYANASSSANEVFKGDKGSIAVLAWTHPGIIQLALATDLGDCRDIRANGLRLRSVEPLTQG